MDWCEFKGLPKPDIRLPRIVKDSLPWIPKEELLDQLIAGVSPRLNKHSIRPNIN